VILIGHSMGAPVALLAAPRLAPRVLGVIGVESLHDATFHYPLDFLENSAAALEADFPKAMEAAIRPTLGGGAAPELGDSILSRALRTDRRAASALLRGLGSFELGPALAEARVPVRAINAAPGSAGRLATDVAGNRKLCDFEATLLDDVGHFPML